MEAGRFMFFYAVMQNKKRKLFGLIQLEIYLDRLILELSVNSSK